MFYPLGLSITHFRPVADNVSFRVPLCRCSSGNRQLGALKGAAAVDIVFDMATSKTCLRPVPDADSLSFVPVLVGPEPWQLVGLDGAAAVDLVINMATSTTSRGCLRPVPDADSLSLVPVLVGLGPASGSGRCGSRRPRLRHGHLDGLFPRYSWQRVAWMTLKGLFRGHESQNVICHLISIRASAMLTTGHL